LWQHQVTTLHNLAQYRNEDRENILHKLRDSLKFKYISSGQVPANYSCLMGEVVKLKNKKDYISENNMKKIRTFKREIDEAILRHNADWFDKPVRKIKRRSTKNKR
jgi:hypothetical protein